MRLSSTLIGISSPTSTIIDEYEILARRIYDFIELKQRRTRELFLEHLRMMFSGRDLLPTESGWYVLNYPASVDFERCLVIVLVVLVVLHRICRHDLESFDPLHSQTTYNILCRFFGFEII
jgi:hypothetical protein